MSDVQELREGDIFHWRWKDEARHLDGLTPWRSYHCKSRIAIVHGKHLYDTFWSDFSSEHRIDPEQVILTFEGNPADMTEIKPHEVAWYRREDIVDMRHSNNTGAPIYLRAGASRNAEEMLEVVRYRIEKKRSEIQWAEDSIERLQQAEALILAGKLDEVSP